MSYPFQTYAIDDIIAETGATLACLAQPCTMFPTQYAESLVYKSLRCGEFYDEYVLEGISIERLYN